MATSRIGNRLQATSNRQVSREEKGRRDERAKGRREERAKGRREDGNRQASHEGKGTKGNKQQAGKLRVGIFLFPLGNISR
ncbi:MAG: hypothetical protein LBL13_12905 [Bacteroidales bacterium]|nr:hypothetical protein [Bacteroidales bacterium]